MLSLDNICFSVKTDQGRKEILKGVSFTVDDPFTVITGPNGGGKSTIARLIAGIYKPDSGRILLDGVDVTGLSVTERARAGISYAFQTPVRFKGVTVSDLLNVASGKPLSVNDACACLSSVGLCARDYLNREVNASLSGGELKRIEIATVLARKTPFAVFDEPEAGIDLWSFSSLIKVFENLRESLHGNIVIISHQERILSVADRIVVIADGRVERTGTREQILPTLFSGGFACEVLESKMGGGV